VLSGSTAAGRDRIAGANTIERRILEAYLPRVKTLEGFDYTQSPNVTAAKMRDLVDDESGARPVRSHRFKLVSGGETKEVGARVHSHSTTGELAQSNYDGDIPRSSPALNRAAWAG
jgi:hypothetical protein